MSDKTEERLRILLVDDEFVILETLRLLLQTQGYDLVPVRDSAKAKDMLGSERFDLMITDLRMNPVDGLELLRTAQERCPGMPCLMLTAFGAQEIIDRAKSYGARAFLDKPFKPDKVFAAVRLALGLE